MSGNRRLLITLGVVSFSSLSALIVALTQIKRRTLTVVTTHSVDTPIETSSANNANENGPYSQMLKLGAQRTAIQLSTFLPQIHLTLISVLQGLVLAILIDEFRWSGDIAYFLRSIDSLLIIVLVWFLYCFVFVIFVWPLSYWHTLLQFALAVAQSFAFLHISDSGAWTLGLAAICFIACLIRLTNTYLVKPRSYERPEVYEIDMQFEKEAFVIFLLLALFYLVLGILQKTYGGATLNMPVSVGTLVIICLLALLSARTNTRLVHEYLRDSPLQYMNGQLFRRLERETPHDSNPSSRIADEYQDD